MNNFLIWQPHFPCAGKTDLMKEIAGKKKAKARSFIQLLLALVIGAWTLSSCKGPATPASSENLQPLNQVERLARSINYKCPFMVDPDTRMDSVYFPNDTTFQYDYTLVKVDAEDVDIMGLTAFVGSSLMEHVQTSSTMKVQRDHRLTMIFYYRDRKGDFVTQIILTPEDYL